MQTKKSVSFFTGAYSLTHLEKLLRIGPFRKGFVWAYFLYKKLFEDAFWNLVRQKPALFQKGDILDIGANMGYTACVFAKALKPPSRVYAFEPDQLSYGLLQEVVRHKKLSSAIEPIRMAVGSSDGYVEFWHNKKHSGDHRVVTERFSRLRPDATKISTVPITTVDAFASARNLQSISFIKIDVQGYELAVCEGMENTLQRFPDLCICLEYSPDALLELGFEPAKVLDFFRTREYQLHLLTRENLQLVTDEASLQRFVNEASYVDLLCSKRALV